MCDSKNIHQKDKCSKVIELHFVTVCVVGGRTLSMEFHPFSFG